ncbi:L-threonine 3-O-phosphate decarboxylase [hydrothermal vent metagenome]|uniref:threonine-phosphate decarboxylase n=1 Tax=hydrothermal vent metagenome TaxID=652676 RepID=A0A3B0XVX6_9ZZZZ
MLHHGGRLIQAAKQYNIPLEQWLDLSTGINPDGWPVPNIPERIFNRLPEEEDGLHQVAKDYYQATSLLAIPGSQAVIQLLPSLRNKSRVAVPDIGYAEHAHAWRQAGHEVTALSKNQIDENLEQYDVLVIINPNNPAGDYYTAEQLLDWHKRLQLKNGWLIVDEAFIDSRMEYSVARYANQPGLVVLKSMGKFFGLAGIRSGFVIAEEVLLKKIKQVLGPWAVSGPSRFIAMQALQDKSWQQMNRAQLIEQAEQLKSLLARYIRQDSETAYIKGTDLFQTLFCDKAEALHKALARKGVFTRLLDDGQGVRFGLAKQEQWLTLEQVFEYVAECNNVAG